jgi:hypothetical protein
VRTVEAIGDARQKLIDLLRKATKLTEGSKKRRLDSKTRRSAVNRLRGGAIDD